MDQDKETNLDKVGLPDIMDYESKIWSVADLLLSAAIQQSKFPEYMMPFFALMMLEGRMRNYAASVTKKEGLTPENNPDDFLEAFMENDCGYNEFIVMKGKTLQEICKNDKTFEQDFGAYLAGFDSESKRLLGIDRGKSEKFLNMDTIVANLRAKKILFPVVSTWATIDLAPYSNSDITTLEEHIKRKWADMSASTAGEQYTPDDIISLISEIVAAMIDFPKNKFLHLYDPTCGGANLLFGVADRLKNDDGYNFIHTCGSEMNDSLCALAAIESHFRQSSEIHYGNTLTTMPFPGTRFNVIVANPPYGTKWSGFEREIRKDESGQFDGGIPSVSDGQMLFMQHILYKLEDDGLAVEVHNGASLFSGDAGSGESNIRKYVFDHDWVEAIIQMPQQEFFNTGIYTYLWVMNKKKPYGPHKNLVALIDGSKGWKLLKKSKGDKRREMPEENRKKIVDALKDFVPSDICKIFDREHFYYNKQQLILTELDDNGKSVKDTVCPDGKAFDITDDEDSYVEDYEHRTIIHTKEDGTKEELGCGEIRVKFTKVKSGVKRRVQIVPRLTKDYEIIPFHFDEDENRKEIDNFMDKYIFKPYTLGNDVIGVEINFNKEFYVPEPVEPVDDILAEIKELDKELGEIEL